MSIYSHKITLNQINYSFVENPSVTLCRTSATIAPKWMDEFKCGFLIDTYFQKCFRVDLNC